MQLSPEQIKKFKEINQKNGLLLDKTDDEIIEIANGTANFFLTSVDIKSKRDVKNNNVLEQCPCGQCTMHDKS